METIENGCPLCKGDVIGDDEHEFYCKGCNILFSRQSLQIQPVEEEE